MNTADTLNLAAVPFYQWDSLLATVQEQPAFAGLDMMDSVFAPQTETDTLQRPSMFEAHGLVPSHNALVARNDSAAPAWVFATLLALLSLTALYCQSRKIRLPDLLASIVSQRALDRLQRNHNLLRPMQLIPSAMLAAACVALPVHCLALNSTGFVGYLLLWAVLMAAFLLRNTLMRLLATVFGKHGSTEPYLASNCLYYLTLTIALLPLLLLFFYMPGSKEVVLYAIFILISVELLVRIVRGLQLFLTHSSGARFFIFYYLCIVELAPILVLVKWLIE